MATITEVGGRTMTREEAINKLRDMITEIRAICDESKHMNEDDRQDMETFDMAIKALEQEPRWIPVSEKLPEKNGEYLITGRQGAVNKRRYHDGHWYSNWSVIAWMPLPEPYKAESEV